MKIVITGHTKGLGKYFYDYFLNDHEVIGLSRTNGFNIETEQEKIIEIVSSSDLFINCANAENAQLELLLKSINKVKNIIVIGTAMQQFDEFINLKYIQQKRQLANACSKLSIDPSVTSKILLLNISFLPKTKDSLLQTDNYIKYSEVSGAVEYWLTWGNISEITFSWKMTTLVESEFQKIIPNLAASDFLKV